MRMKRLLLCFLAVVIPFAVLSQTESAGGITIFDDFVDSKVVMKNGQFAKARLNYDKMNKKILLEDNGEVSILILGNDISYLTMGGRYFEPVDAETFYEKIESADGDTEFYVFWENQVMQGKKGAYGAVSQTSNIKSVDNYQGTLGGTRVKLDAGDVESVKPQNTYYLKLDGAFKSFHSAKSLGRIFKKNAKDIENYAKQYNIDFQNVDDVKKIVAFCGQFI